MSNKKIAKELRKAAEAAIERRGDYLAFLELAVDDAIEALTAKSDAKKAKKAARKAKALAVRHATLEEAAQLVETQNVYKNGERTGKRKPLPEHDDLYKFGRIAAAKDIRALIESEQDEETVDFDTILADYRANPNDLVDH